MRKMKFNLQRFSVYGTSGNDTLKNTTSNAVVYGYGGNDSIYNSANYATISGGDGNDTITNVYSGGGDVVSINGGAGNDYIYNNYGYNLTIDGGADSDTINVYRGANNSINGGAGNDLISLRSNYGAHTIMGGIGNDTIYGDTVNSSGVMYKYDSGDGNDIIYNAKSNDTISISGGSYTTSTIGSNVIVNVDRGTITLVGARYNMPYITAEPSYSYIKNTVSRKTVNGTSGNDLIENSGDYSTIYAGDGADSIYSQDEDDSYINGGAGNDTIEGRYWYSTLDGGTDDDKIIANYHYRSSINGGAGNDIISLVSGSSSTYYSSTIAGGTGNDSIFGDSIASHVYQYASGDGYDIITGFKTNDTLHITSGSISNAVKSGNDVIFNVGSGTITLKDKAGQTIYYKVGNGSLQSTIISSNAGTSGADNITNTLSGATIDALAGNDTLKNSGTSAKIYGGADNDSIYNNASYATLSGGDGNDTIYNYGSSSASSTSVSSSYQAYNVSINGGAGADSIYNYGGRYTTIDGGDGNDTIYSYANNASIIGGYGADSIYNSGATVTMDGGSGNDTIRNYGAYAKVYGGADNDSIYNNANYATLSGGDGNDTIYNYNSYGASTSSVSSSYQAYNVSINGGTGADSIYNYGGRYTTIDGGADEDTINVYRGFGNSINGGAGNDKINLSSSYGTHTVIGGAGNDTIFGDTASSYGMLYKYYVGDGNDIIYNVKANDTVSIGGGSYSTAKSGSYTILSAGSGTNAGSITLSGAMPNIIGTLESAVIINTISGTNVYGTSDKDTIWNKNTGTYAKIYGGSDNDSIYNNANYATLSGGDGNDTIFDVYNGGGDYVSINGDSGNDYIYTNWVYNSTIDGGADADTINVYLGASNSINGGAGNDRISLSSSNGAQTIMGGTGNDTIFGDTSSSYGVLYQYNIGDGNDIIYNVKANDTVSIGGGTLGGGSYSTTKSGSYTILSAGSGTNAGSITLSGAMPIVKGTLESSVIINTVTGATVNDTVGVNNILNVGRSAKINGLTGNDSISNSASYATLSGGDGNDTIINVYSSATTLGVKGTGGDYVSISGGAGSDYIYTDWAWSSTIDGDADNDIINVYRGSGNSINGGAGNDVISLSSSSSKQTITGGTGNDTIFGDSLSSYGVVYQYNNGDGNDVIYNVRYNDTIQIVGSGYTTSYSGNNGIINIGSNSITLVGARYNMPNIVAEGMYIENSVSNTLVSSGSGNDTIKNYGSGATISSGAGNDSIYNSATSASIVGGNDNDTINNTGSYSKVYGDAGNDSIYNSASYVTISGGDGNDTITNVYSSGGDDVSISGGAGSDYIYDNYGYRLTIDGGADNDTINVYRGANNSINAGAGNDRISLSSSYGRQTVIGGTGNDTIYGDSLSSYGIVYEYNEGDGNDTIYGYKANDSLNITGNYTASTVGNNVIISAGSGSLTIINGKGKVSLPTSIIINTVSGANVYGGTAVNDTIWNKNTGTSARVYGYGGNDSIYNSAQKATIYGGDGKDTIFNVYANGTRPDSVYISGGNDNDVIYNDRGAGYSTIDGGAGNDSLYSYNWHSSKIIGGDGNDTIVEYGTFYNSINAGAGNDVISLKSSYASTITGGTGNDTIFGDTLSSNGMLYQYALGDGNDIIYNVKANDTVSIGGVSSYTTTKSGSNIIVNVGSGTNAGKITLSGAAPIIYPSVQGGRYVVNTTSGASIEGNSYNDTIINNLADYVSVSTGIGDDTIYNNYGYYVTINGGAGNDTITDYKGNLGYIDGGAGNDVISLKSSAGILEVRGGTGNDTIYGDSAKGALYHYQIGDGSDIIYSLNVNDSISITGGSYKKSTVGNDIIVSVSGGKVTLSGAKGKSIKFYGTSADTNSTLTAQSVIKKFMAVLDTVTSSGVAALNQAVNIASNGYFSNAQAAINQMVADCQSAPDSDTFLQDKCGIILNNADTGAITGSDAGGSTTKTASSIVPEYGSLNSFTGSSFTTNGLTVQLAGMNDDVYNLSYGSLTSNAQRYIWQAAQTWWIPESLNLIAESYGDNYGFTSSSSATVKKIYFGFETGNSGTLATTWHWWTSNNPAKASQLAMIVNLDYYSNIDTSSVDGKSTTSGATDLDRVLSHEFTHAVMAANIDYFRSLPQFIKEGMAELTHGIDDTRGNVISYLAGNSTALANSLSLNNLGTGTTNAYAGGYMFLRYLAQQASENASSSSSMSMLGSGNHSAGTSSVAAQSGISIKGAVLTATTNFQDDRLSLMDYVTTVTKVDATKLTRGIEIVGSEKANSIKAGTGSDTISGNTGNDTIYAGKGNDFVSGDAGNDSLFGEAGNDTLSGGIGKDTLTGGAGNDIFIHSGDYDYIADYEVGKDKIKLSASSITGASTIGSDLILKTISENFGMEGAITIKGGNGKNITVIDADDNETTQIYSISGGGNTGITVKGATLTASKEFNGGTINLEDYASTVTKINASAVTIATAITGNSSANSIKGGTKNDTIYGGAGVDTLFGGSGNDIIYGDAGNDKLSGDAGNDKLYGGDGNDSLSGGAGVDTLYGGLGTNTLTGGAGNDVFVFSGGSDLITDYTAGQDKIKIESGALSKVSISGSNVIFTVDGKSNFTVKGGKGKKISVVDANNSTTTKVWANWTAPETVSAATLPAGLSYDSAKKKITAATTYSDSAIDLTNYASTVVTLDASKLTKAVKITGNENSNSISGGSKNDTLSGGEGNDILLGNAGNDTLYGNNGNDTLTGGAGSDVFVFAAGNDVITDYTAGQDKIKISSGSITKTTFNGSDVTFAIGSGNLTVKNGNGKNITIIDSANKTTTKLYTSDTLPTGLSYDSTKKKITVATNYNGSAIDLADYASSVASVDASKFTKVIEITGNSNANSIKGGSKNDTIYGGAGVDTLFGGSGNDIIYGDAGNDKLSGDAGNDKLYGGDGNDSLSGGAGVDTIYGGSGTNTLTGGAGNDVFVFSGGSDLITDYTAGQDKIKIESGTLTRSSISGSNIVFTIGEGTLTVKNGKGKKITITDSANKTTTKTYTNATYTSSTSKMLESESLWFMDDDTDFAAQDTNIDSVSNITDDNYSIDSVTSALSYDSLTSDNPDYQATYATGSNKIK